MLRAFPMPFVVVFIDSRLHVEIIHVPLLNTEKNML